LGGEGADSALSSLANRVKILARAVWVVVSFCLQLTGNDLSVAIFVIISLDIILDFNFFVKLDAGIKKITWQTIIRNNK